MNGCSCGAGATRPSPNPEQASGLTVAKVFLEYLVALLCMFICVCTIPVHCDDYCVGGEDYSYVFIVGFAAIVQ
jgi:hypothetical protein